LSARRTDQCAIILGLCETILLPTLKRDDIVVMDNLSSHKGKQVRDAIRSVGAHRIFLPAYSSDLNPIEQVFSKLKALLRKARARTFDVVSGSIGDLLNKFSPTEMRQLSQQFRLWLYLM
jgi:transposase